MITNHGMYDFAGEVYLTAGGSGRQALFADKQILFKLLNAAGIVDPLIKKPPQYQSTEQLYGVFSGGYKNSSDFLIPGLNAPLPKKLGKKDGEPNLGNTGFSILAVVLEKAAAKGSGGEIRSLEDLTEIFH